MNATDLDTSSVSSEDLSPLKPLQELLKLAHSSELISSRAFFNPNMLGQLYFPDEHKYAVYTPLFGPLAVPLLVAGLRLLKERRRVKAQNRAMKISKSV
jgi:phosphatidylinositol glycan class S